MGLLDDFVMESQGQCLDLDHAFGCQCVDLADAWGNALGHPLPLVAAAKDFAGMSIAGFQWVSNGLGNAPAPGDLVVWDARIGPYGHVALCIGPADANTFNSLDQNWYGANGATGSPAARVQHNYFGVAGWQHPMSGGSQMTWDGTYPMPDPPPAGTSKPITYSGRILPRDGAGNPPRWFDGPDGKDMGPAPVGADVSTAEGAFDGVNWWDRIAPGTWWLLDSAIDGRDGSHPNGQTPVSAWNEAHQAPVPQPPATPIPEPAPTPPAASPGGLDLPTIARQLRALAHQLDGQ